MEKLFIQEVPEIYDGLIEIKSSSRDPGSRAKICVKAVDTSLDPVGACVGMRGSRIQSIVRELNGEKIDIINFSDQPEILLTRAIAPAKPLNMLLDEKRSYAVIVFEDEELAVAISLLPFLQEQLWQTTFLLVLCMCLVLMTIHVYR